MAGSYDASLPRYCLVSGDYLELNLTFGYRFTLLDLQCSKTPEENCVIIGFAGGGGTAGSGFLQRLL